MEATRLEVGAGGRLPCAQFGLIMDRDELSRSPEATVTDLGSTLALPVGPSPKLTVAERSGKRDVLVLSEKEVAKSDVDGCDAAALLWR
jgi:hypothetical protein